MRSLLIEFGIVGAAMFALGVYWISRPPPAAALVFPPSAEFSLADYNAFDRNFLIGEDVCSVGLAEHRFCLGHSPVEGQLRRGMVLPPEIPLIAAEFRVIVATELKDDALRIVRYGQTVVLVDPETRIVKDVLRLGAPDFETARGMDFS
jgi:hypothetical protein